MIVRQLVATYVLLVALAIGGFTIPVAVTLTGQLRSDTESAVRREAETGARLLAVDDDPSRQALDSLVDAFERETPGRMDVLLAGGRPAGPRPMPVASDDAAFSAALAGREWQRWGHAVALDAEGLVLAVPAQAENGEVVGAVRISYPAAPVDTRIREIWLFRAALAVAVLIVAALLGSLLARRLTRPLRELNEMASVLRDGDLTARAKESGPAEVRTLARTLNTATETIDALIRSQRAFVADASHQLRTPLTALRLALDNIADGTDDPTTREDVERATAEVVRMTRLVNGLLALAKAQAQVAPVARVPVNRVVAERFEIWRAVADDRTVELRLDAPASDVFALATPGHLEQMLDNVLSNALDFSPGEGVVTVSVHRQDSQVVITVLDDGPGLSPAQRERAFDRFWRGPAGQGRSGFGLGLAIVKQLVVDNGGTVDLAAAPSGGAAVRITLRAA
ncbi:HAMP domain-containing sensor histidine kinase [Micromonospora sp. KC721]|uniref:HAMP domain-containing sensor histidine kinase n=1 Tax=Micromonospora sp. KC721 TaxID=2530380 RepID=UPI001A9E89FE|nr:HAMP domain-containing sensor histidine kinase [Micromonospora sp. KC721]